MNRPKRHGPAAYALPGFGEPRINCRAVASAKAGSPALGEAIRLEWIGPERFFAAVGLLRKHADRHWSFTDCLSFGVMREVRVRDAFTTHHHFKQAGFVPLLGS